MAADPDATSETETGASETVGTYEDGFEPIFCVTCQCWLSTITHVRSHYRSQWHRYNIKRKCVGLKPLTKESFEAKVKQYMASEKDDKPKSKVYYYCTLTKKKFKTEPQMLQHVASKKYKKMYKQTALANAKMEATLPPVAEEAPGPPPEHLEGNGDSPAPDAAEATDADADQSQSTSNTTAVSTSQKASTSSGSTEGEDANANLPPFIVLRTVQAKRARPIPSEALQREGSDDDFEEGGEPSDFTQSETASRASSIPRQPNPTPLRHIVGINDLDELILSDGTIIGHRKFRREYSQAVRPEETREAVLRNLEAKAELMKKYLTDPKSAPPGKIQNKALMVQAGYYLPNGAPSKKLKKEFNRMKHFEAKAELHQGMADNKVTRVKGAAGYAALNSGYMGR